MIELLIIEAMFVSRLRRRKYFLLRLIPCIIIIFTVVTFFPLKYDALYNSFMFLLFFVLTLLMVIFCFRDRLWNVLFCCLAAYTVQHVAYLLNTILINLFIDDYGNVYQGGELPQLTAGQNAVIWIVYFACYLMVYAEAYLLLISIIPKNPDLQLGRTVMIVICGLVIIVDIVFNMYTVYNTEGTLAVFLEEVYNLIICLLVLQMQFQKLRQKKILEDYDVIQKILEKEQMQYKHLKDNMNIINVKCHDLKHQLRAIRHDEHSDLKELKQVEQAISIYQTAARTGNETLDIVLMDKLLYCDKNGINITCIADGQSLSFISEVDIYSLFGNALDNAITAVEPLPEQYRDIKLTVKNIGDVVHVRLENRFKGKIRLEDGVPVTTKKNKQYHGYGFLSMQMIAAKYNGKVKVDVDGDKFILNVVFVNERARDLKAGVAI
ncbi:MAG: sensor histidine kinase [Clostridia bacterium]|nr:sensor histidine kinase [Clostridia bacterium]